MFKIKTRYTALVLLSAVFLLQQSIFAGQIGCQTGDQVKPVCANNCDRQCTQDPNQPPCSGLLARDHNKFAAAQTKYEQTQPPSNGLASIDSPTRLSFSFLLSLLFVFGGLYALFALLFNRLRQRKSSVAGRPLVKTLNFAFAPRFALSAFALLFVAAIAGSWLTAPSAIKAQKRKKIDKSDQSSQFMQAINSPNAATATTKPVFRSAQQIGGSGTTQIGAPVFDTQGNRYIFGGFTGTLTIGATTLTASQDFDLFFAKYDAAGNALWARQATGATGGTVPAKLANEGVSTLAIDTLNGGIYIGGAFVKTVTFQGGTHAPATLTDGGAAGVNYEAFLAQYDTDGNLNWARGGDSASPQHTNDLEIGQNGINKIVLDSRGNPYISGFTSGSNFLGSPLSNYVFTPNNGKSDAILSKINAADGSLVWAQVMGGNGDDNGYDLVVDTSDNLYYVGNYNSTSITFPTTPFHFTFSNPSGATNAFIGRFEPGNGFNIWIKVLDNSDPSKITGVSQLAVDPLGAGVYVTGFFNGQVNIPNGFGSTGFTNTRTGSGEAGYSGYVAVLDRSSGDFGPGAKFEGVGKAIVFGPDGVTVVGTLWNSGNFGIAGSSEAEQLDSVGTDDIFVAAYDKFNFSLHYAKAIGGSSYEGVSLLNNPSADDGGTINKYNPLGVSYNPFNSRIYISGDYTGAVSLDCLTLTAPVGVTRSYVGELGFAGEATSCRVWTKPFNSQGGQWDNATNWNGGTIPAANDSVYVPFRKNTALDPVYDTATPMPLNDLSISSQQTLALQQNLTVNGRLDLLGGFVNTGANTLFLGAASQPLSINGGRVIGQVSKAFDGSNNSFTFPVGTANGYSPVTLSNVAGTGSFAVTANQGAYPNTATNLPANRANRWWNLTNGGLSNADVTFQYLAGDITSGTESNYRAYRITAGGGAATLIPSSINTAAKTVTSVNISDFSDWMLAQPALAPTAAKATVGGRVLTARGTGIASARISLIDSQGKVRTALTNSFGYYRLTDVPAGAAYVLTASDKRYRFSQPTQYQSITADRDDINFVAAP